jgi:hypothetical protein
MAAFSHPRGDPQSASALNDNCPDEGKPSVSNHRLDSAVVAALVRWAALPDRDLVRAIWLLLGPSCVARARTGSG